MPLAERLDSPDLGRQVLEVIRRDAVQFREQLRRDRRSVSPASYTANRMLDEPPLIVRTPGNADFIRRLPHYGFSRPWTLTVPQQPPAAVHNGQARGALFVELSASFFNGLVRAATRRRGAHDRFDAYFRGAPVISCHPATHVTLGDDADQLEFLGILNHRRAAAT
jgi:hypothetical protein